MDAKATLGRCRNGGTVACRHIVEQYQAQALGRATAVVGNRDDAMDAVQEAFIDAFQSLERFDLDRKFYPWYYIILRNRCYKLTNARKQRDLSNVGEMEILAATTSVKPEVSMLLDRCLLELPMQDRELHTLRHLDGLSYQELAERLEVPTGTRMSRLFHARKKLRDTLARHHSWDLRG